MQPDPKTATTDVVVVVQPVTHSLLHLCNGEEEIHVEALISQLPRCAR